MVFLILLLILPLFTLIVSLAEWKMQHPTPPSISQWNGKSQLKRAKESNSWLSSFSSSVGGMKGKQAYVTLIEDGRKPILVVLLFQQTLAVILPLTNPSIMFCIDNAVESALVMFRTLQYTSPTRVCNSFIHPFILHSHVLEILTEKTTGINSCCSSFCWRRVKKKIDCFRCYCKRGGTTSYARGYV